jgi:hypothetical protein
MVASELRMAPVIFWCIFLISLQAAEQWGLRVI